MSSKESSGRSTRRNPTRNCNSSISSAASSSNSNSTSSQNGSSSSASSSRPIRSSRLKASNNHINLCDDSSEESGSEDIKPIGPFNIKKSNSKTSTNGISSNGSTSNQTTTTSSSSSTSSTKLDLDKLAKLENITGLSRAEAIQLLEAAQNKLEKAVDLHFNTNTNDSNSKRTNKRSFAHVEDSNSNEPVYDDDNVRAPIPQKIEKLLDYDPYALMVEPQPKRVRSVFENYRTSYNDLNTDGPFEGAASSSNSSKAKSLAALYKPPVDLLFKGSFEASKIEGCQKNKWVMINVQDPSDFACQCLNRDLWREDTVKEIIRANFIFVQIYFDSIEGKRLINYYKITTYPFIGILDPRTGENVAKSLFHNISKMDQFMFCEKVTNFLCDFESPIKDFNEKDACSSSGLMSINNDNEIVQVDDDSKEKDDCILINNDSNNKNSKANPNFIKASDFIKELNGDTNKNGIITKPDIIDTNSNSSDETIKFKNKNKNTKQIIDSGDSSSSSESDSEDNSAVISKDKFNNLKEMKNQSYQPKLIRFEQPDTEKLDCVLRILYPNGDRLDYCTNGNSKFKDLIDHLYKQGYKKKKYELIERLMPNIQPITKAKDNFEQQKSNESTNSLSQTSKISNDLSNLLITNQSRNLFNLDNLNSSFRDLNLFPRVFLLLQEY